mgnify:CR=1 FL=1
MNEKSLKILEFNKIKEKLKKYANTSSGKDLIEALFALQVQNKTKFSLGLFGDTMQRIYSDGKEKLGEDLPEDWVCPVCGAGKDEFEKVE